MPDDPILVAEVPVGAEIVRVELKFFNGRRIFSACRHGLAVSVERLPDIMAAFEKALVTARQTDFLPDEVDRT
jgi:hypothetical protein